MFLADTEQKSENVVVRISHDSRVEAGQPKIFFVFCFRARRLIEVPLALCQPEMGFPIAWSDRYRFHCGCLSIVKIALSRIDDREQIQSSAIFGCLSSAAFSWRFVKVACVK